MMEDGLAAPLQPVDVRRMTGAMDDVKTAHGSLNAKILDVLDALQDQVQGQKWFNEWQVKVDVYTMWIYKWQYILDEAVNNYTKATNAASHPLNLCTGHLYNLVSCAPV